VADNHNQDNASGPGADRIDSSRIDSSRIEAGWTSSGHTGGGPPDARRIDVHHHATPAAVRDWLVQHGLLPPVGGPPWSQWSLADALATMDAYGIEVAVVSAAIPPVFFADPAQQVALARIANDALAELPRDRPDRFGFLAYLPLADPAAAVAELDRALDTLNADGVLLMSHTGSTHLGDPAFDPVWAALDHRATPVLTHPFDLAGCGSAPIPTFLADFPADTTRSAIQMIKNGVLDRFPRIPIILPHGGGFLPYQAARLTLGVDLGYGVDAATVRRSLPRFHYDTAGPMSPYQTPTLLAAAGVDRILYGSDYNAVPASTVGAGLAAFLADPALRAHDQRRVGRENALRLFPALARRIRAAPAPPPNPRN
jgi:predicted TIM-barrel fold metal-dependent hydrolase